jgi:hypothetical protein
MNIKLPRHFTDVWNNIENNNYALFYIKDTPPHTHTASLGVCVKYTRFINDIRKISGCRNEIFRPFTDSIYTVIELCIGINSEL